VFNHLRFFVLAANNQEPTDDGAAASSSATTQPTAAAEAEPDAPPMRISLQTKCESILPALAAPSVLLLLLLELLQLLAAYYDQQPNTHGKALLAAYYDQQPNESREREAALVDDPNALLWQQLSMLTACNSAGYGIRRSAVLRQSGQQLLQLLRWQVQLWVRRWHASSSSSSSRDSGSAADEDYADMCGTSSKSALLLNVMWAAGAWDPSASKEGGRPHESAALCS
jgi:hypothetical protein